METGDLTAAGGAGGIAHCPLQRVLGQQVLEVEGIPAEQVETLAEKARVWWRPFSTGFLLVLPSTDLQSFFHRIEDEQPIRLLRCKANLEDVFLRLTGDHL
ncbi:MAG: hypothetical protein ACUVRV_13380 [Cyanobacteriota bacterium]